MDMLSAGKLGSLLAEWYDRICSWTDVIEKKRTTLLDLSGVTEDDKSKLDTEGWAWYYNATDEYAAKTLVMDGFKQEIPDAISESMYGIILPDGTTIALSPESKNSITTGNMSMTSQPNSPLYCQGTLTFGYKDGTGELSITSGNTTDNERAYNYGILADNAFIMNGNKLAISVGRGKTCIRIKGSSVTFNNGDIDINVTAEATEASSARFGVIVTDESQINGGKGSINCEIAGEGFGKKAFGKEPHVGTNVNLTGTATSSACSWTTGSGVTNIPVANIAIYPNPAAEELNVQSETAVNKIEVLDLAGSLQLQNTGAQSITVSDLAQGMYIVRISTESGVVTRKFLKK